MNYVNLRNGLASSLLCSLLAAIGCGGDNAATIDENRTTNLVEVDSRAIYRGIDNVHEIIVDENYIYWSVDIDGDDVKDIGGLWRAPKDGSGTPIRLAKAREAEMLTVLGSDVFYRDRDGANGVYRVTKGGVAMTNDSRLSFAPSAITSDGQTLYGVAPAISASTLWADSIVAYDPGADSWGTLVGDAGSIDNMVTAGDYLYLTLYGKDDGNASLARVQKSGGALEQLRQIDAKYGELYSSGNRLLLRSWGTDGIPIKVEELNVDDGSVGPTVDTNDCQESDNWRAYNGHFYCFAGLNFKTFAETTSSEQAIVSIDELWDLAVDGEYVYWVGTESVSGMWLTGVYIGRQRL